MVKAASPHPSSFAKRLKHWISWLSKFESTTIISKEVPKLNIYFCYTWKNRSHDAILSVISLKFCYKFSFWNWRSSFSSKYLIRFSVYKSHQFIMFYTNATQKCKFGFLLQWKCNFPENYVYLNTKRKILKLFLLQEHILTSITKFQESSSEEILHFDWVCCRRSQKKYLSSKLSKIRKKSSTVVALIATDSISHL